jgi:hypothetical protein
VKSFNEENVVRCIEDVSFPPNYEARAKQYLQSIWTTQVENGEIFKAAFLKYKNVILVFSVNQSRAFQGYVSDPLLAGFNAAPVNHGLGPNGKSPRQRRGAAMAEQYQLGKRRSIQGMHITMVYLASFL